MTEDRYETIDIIVKERLDGTPWFDIIFDLIAGECEGGGGDCILVEGEESDCDNHEHTELLPCTCGLESMGGSSGTLDQCYRHRGIADDIVQVKKADVLAVIEHLRENDYSHTTVEYEAAERLRKECIWWDDNEEDTEEE